MNRKEISREALLLRNKYAGGEKLVNPYELGSRLGIKIISYTFPENIFGLLVFLKGKAYIGINRFLYPFWKQFTLAHELGHFTLHQYKFYLCGLSGTSKEEEEANYFASELLVPGNLLVKERAFKNRDYKTISLKYKVPVEAVEKMVKDCGG
ncbi:MAG: hypothetical protein DDT40_00808 [candidate division WS2 bacterium]|uniref:IrrE N-terminal-like domain-containing protein n=1 Tax=Psychracetigena formicireducens TaxID=2986056 RepID=A0A9E2BGI4_PSYF1|nr:hypothetical protein [Candidatus Psychracetigena formicireducens]MBT9145171.1 hypothetical protein [Candidatus Psychracetigena formicireducens]MBT9150633.1 hypothetical protein [Candidatus Psychracetigena formicireducens]